MANKDTFVVAYVPSWHAGYQNFFERYKAHVYLIGEDFLSVIPRLDRDIRAINPQNMSIIIKSLNIASSVSVLNKSNLKELHNQHIIMPDEETSRDFADSHLTKSIVEYIQVFLRWDRKISLQEDHIPADRIVSSNSVDVNNMNKAMIEARKSPDWWRQVGAFAITKNKTTMLAHNSPMPSHDFTLNTFGDPRSNFDYGENIDLSKCIHAEAKLIADAARRGITLDGADLYVTTYPCPPCAKSIATAGFKKVLYRDGYSLLDAEDILKAYGIEIILVKKLPATSQPLS